MYCRNCGKLLNEDKEQTFCPYCGTKKIDEQVSTQEINTTLAETVTTNINNDTTKEENTNVNQEVNTSVNQKTVQEVNPNTNQETNNSVSPTNNLNNTKTEYNENNKPKKTNPLTIILIIFGVFIGIIILIVVSLFTVVSNSSNTLVCTSDKGDITLIYNENEIIGYSASGITYDLDDEKEVSKKIGISAYLEEFNNQFELNTGGKCTINNKEMNSNTHDNNRNQNTNNNTTKETEQTDEKTKVVGDKKYGYLTIPSTWSNFYDVEGTTALQYSYANLYIVTMDYVRDNQGYTAKELAQSYLSQMKNSSEVSNPTGSTSYIGKNKEYKAYQVYMYYPSDGTYLVTYWFDTGDGVVRYLALEGPAELSGVKITDYLYIIESFSLNK